MAEVIEDIHSGHSVQADENGFSATRVFFVRGLQGNRPVRILNALLEPSVPQQGEVYPEFAAMAVVSRSAEPLPDSTVDAKVTVNYKLVTADQSTPGETQRTEFEITSTVQSTQTQKDFENKQLFVDYFFPLNAVDPETGQKDDRAGGPTIRQFGSVEKQVPLMVARARRKEKQDTREKAKVFVGKVNENEFLGDPPKFWLCSNISSRTTDGGATFDVVYEFIRNESGGNGWDTDIIFIDPRNNRPVEIRLDQKDKAFKKEQIYETINFNALNIDFGQEGGGGFPGGLFGAGQQGGGTFGAGQTSILSF